MDKEAKKLLQLIIKRLDAIDAKLDEHTVKLDEHTVKLGQHDGKFIGLIGAVTALQNDVSYIKENYATKEDVQVLRNVLEDFAGSVQALEENSPSFFKWQSRQDKDIANLKKAVGIA